MVAAVEVVVDKDLPVALHVVDHRADPGQARLVLEVELSDLVLDAVPNVIVRRRLVTFVRLKKTPKIY